MKSFILFPLSFVLISSCTPEKETMQTNSKANRLINSNSPYLLQHAYNPVDWYSWGNEAFEKARNEDKPLILSIGYSSCHWCHVMERESFENDTLAEVMNKYFVSIKVDREERPDVDQIYMDAVQAMGMSGGWPLNVFLTPDLKPFYGGTYFPPQQWHQLLNKIATVYKEKKDEVEESADQLANALQASEIRKYNLALSEKAFSSKLLDTAYEKIQSRFDNVYGGIDKAPKFPMPSIWMFLLRYATMTNNTAALDHLKLTLNKMAAGGIYDQAGGGFTRYSTDKEWKVPHFEKMLYDNGQLLSLYSEAYNATGEEFYKATIENTVDWLEREMLAPKGGFYSALDADSEGEEGKFYVFTIEEIENELPEEIIPLAKEYYNISAEGNWEHGKNILHAEMTPEAYAASKNLDVEDVKKQLNKINSVLLRYRSSRVRPGLDNKILTSWNALAITGLADAYKATGEDRYLKMAVRTTEFINDNLTEKGRLLRSYNNGKAHINAYMEDYAHFIYALIKVYEITFNEKYLLQAKRLTDHVLSKFYDENEGMFFYTSDESEALIARKKEIFDNVIPSSNSVMGTNLHLLSLYFDETSYREISEKMLRRVSELLPQEPVYLSNWGILYYYFSNPTAEIVIVGDKYQDFRSQLEQNYLPNKIIMGAASSGNLPLMENRTAKDGKATIYVCYNKTCKLPVHSTDEALKQLD